MRGIRDVSKKGGMWVMAWIGQKNTSVIGLRPSTGVMGVWCLPPLRTWTPRTKGPTGP
jgi:hypothetical protein